MSGGGELETQYSHAIINFTILTKEHVAGRLFSVVMLQKNAASLRNLIAAYLHYEMTLTDGMPSSDPSAK